MLCLPRGRGAPGVCRGADLSETAQIQPSEFRLDHLNSGIHLCHPRGTRGSSQEVSSADRGSGVDGADSHIRSVC